MPGNQLAAVVLVAVVTLAACGSEGGSGPNAVDLAGTWYGTSTYSVAACDGPLPPGVETTPYGTPRLLEMTKTGTDVSAADLTDTFHYVGSFDGGSGGLAAQFPASLDGADHVDVTDTVTATVSGAPLHLTASGSRRSAIQWSDPQQADRVCTRTVTWDLTRRSTPVPELAAVDCAQEAVLRPSGQLASALVRVDNGSSEAVAVYRLDQAGARVLLDSLDPSSGVWLSGLDLPVEPLVVASADGTCRGIYLPVEGPAFINLK
jgi:hypothetical protein